MKILLPLAIASKTRMRNPGLMIKLHFRSLYNKRFTYLTAVTHVIT